MPASRKRVLAFGTFDLLHPGHTYFLRQAKAQGNYLVVVVTRDILVRRQKGRRAVESELERFSAVLAQPVVDEAYLGSQQPNSYELLRSLQFDVLAVGYDQLADDSLQTILEHVGKSGIPVARIPAYQPETYKSSLIRDTLNV